MLTPHMAPTEAYPFGAISCVRATLIEFDGNSPSNRGDGYVAISLPRIPCLEGADARLRALDARSPILARG